MLRDCALSHLFQHVPHAGVNRVFILQSGGLVAIGHLESVFSQECSTLVDGLAVIEASVAD